MVFKKLLLKLLIGDKAKIVSGKDEKYLTNFQKIGRAMNKLEKVIGEDPELEKAVKKRFGE